MPYYTEEGRRPQSDPARATTTTATQGSEARTHIVSGDLNLSAVARATIMGRIRRGF